MNEFTTVILRFRDLVTAHGDTIRKHKEISEESGYVWWGWWHKGGERIPGKAFRALLSKVRADGLEIYLMDSGQSKLYRVTCLDVTWDHAHAKIKSPEKDATPEYYEGQSYLAWFKLKDFQDEEESPDTVLRQLTYVQVDDFFEEEVSPFEAFYNKRIHSAAELRQQERTIWFVRDFREGDLTHEVNLFHARSTKPVDFALSYHESKSTQILWVSDLHFARKEFHRFPLQSGVHEFDLAHKLEMELKEEVDALAGVIMSGDFAWKAAPDEFELARKFIERLNTWIPLESDQIAICPGNHDVKFSRNPSVKGGARIKIARKNSRKAYSDFYQKLYYRPPNKYMSCGKRLLVGNAVPVDIVCLNSSLLEQYKGAFQGHGFIGQEQMQHAAEEMGWTGSDPEEPRAHRIVVVHHHVLPVTYSAKPEANYCYSVTLDAEALIRWLVEHRVDLVLHGHMHQPSCVKLSRPIDRDRPDTAWHDLYVLGMGSTGVDESHLGEIAKNTFGILDFKKEKITLTVYSIHPTNPSEEEWSIDLPLAH